MIACAGNCVNSFDEDGHCIIDSLPYGDVTEFAQAEENCDMISMDEFMEKSAMTHARLNELGDVMNFVFMKDRENHVLIVYDDIEDVHMFFPMTEEDRIANELRGHLLEIPGFDQFREHPGEFLFSATNSNPDGNTAFYSLHMLPFEGMDYSEINSHRYGTYEFNGFHNVEGSVSSGGPDGVHVNFRADVIRNELQCLKQDQTPKKSSNDYGM